MTFSIGGQYGVPISQVQEIIRIGNITKVPNSLPYMEGVINLRGRVLPVLNLRRRLKLPEKDISKGSRSVVVEAGTKGIGLLVDAVSHVIKVSPEVMERAPGRGPGGGQRLDHRGLQAQERACDLNRPGTFYQEGKYRDTGRRREKGQTCKRVMD